MRTRKTNWENEINLPFWVRFLEFRKMLGPVHHPGQYRPFFRQVLQISMLMLMVNLQVRSLQCAVKRFLFAPIDRKYQISFEPLCLSTLQIIISHHQYETKNRHKRLHENFTYTLLFSPESVYFALWSRTVALFCSVLHVQVAHALVVSSSLQYQCFRLF